MIWKALYNALAIPVLFVGFHVAARFHPKIRAGIAGRRNLFEQLALQLQNARRLNQTLWFHVTSVGEFEQAKPLIEVIKEHGRIVLTYFSPSVHASATSYPYCDAAIYLPLDTRHNATRLIQMIQPSALIFSKFDIWPNLVWCASARQIPIFLIAGTLHEKSKRLIPFARYFFKAVHQHLSVHCVISEADADRFRRICPPNAQIEVTGDTRFESVYRRAVSIDPNVECFPGQSTLQRPIVVAGSTYIEDERVLLDAHALLRQITPESFPHLLLTPHEPTPERIRQIRTLLEAGEFSYNCLSELRVGVDLSQVDVLVIDRVGLLAQLYQLGDIAFVGGSFHGKVHNVMEPAAMAKPILFGPTIHNAYEAYQLQERGAARAVNNARDMASIFQEWLADPEGRNRMGQIGQRFIEESLGATERTLACLGTRMLTQ